MKKLLLLSTLFIAAGFFGCSKVQVSQDYVDIAAFSGLKTFDWHQQPVKYGDDVRENNQLLHQRFVQTIQSVLRDKDYSMSQQADFLVTYRYAITQKIDSYPTTAYYGYGVGRYSYYGGVGAGVGYEIRQYDIGTLVIDIYDAVTNSVIWRGKGSEVVTSHPSPQQTTEMVNRLVSEVLAQFPPG